MSKLKQAICPACNKRIGRHDPNRVIIRAGEGSNHQGVYKALHLDCHLKLQQHLVKAEDFQAK